mmetsp:Transcript_88696/g.236095  ORF Transcript_88696/g.236095 Transcript_88696/m.236095 type:complete len:277 (+) Transcript_88696:1357-2187(+)
MFMRMFALTKDQETGEAEPPSSPVTVPASRSTTCLRAPFFPFGHSSSAPSAVLPLPAACLVFVSFVRWCFSPPAAATEKSEAAEGAGGATPAGLAVERRRGGVWWELSSSRNSSLGSSPTSASTWPILSCRLSEAYPCRPTPPALPLLLPRLPHRQPLLPRHEVEYPAHHCLKMLPLPLLRAVLQLLLLQWQWKIRRPPPWPLPARRERTACKTMGIATSSAQEVVAAMVATVLVKITRRVETRIRGALADRGTCGWCIEWFVRCTVGRPCARRRP